MNSIIVNGVKSSKLRSCLWVWLNSGPSQHLVPFAYTLRLHMLCSSKCKAKEALFKISSCESEQQLMAHPSQAYYNQERLFCKTVTNFSELL